MIRGLKQKGKFTHIIHLLATRSLAFFPFLALPLTEMCMEAIELMRGAATEIFSEPYMFETTEAFTQQWHNEDDYLPRNTHLRGYGWGGRSCAHFDISIR